jgi:hypothetical protein
MSWFYRFFTKSDNEQVVTVTAPYIQLTGSATITGALAQTGDPTITGNQTVVGTGRFTSYIYLGTGTRGIAFGTSGVDPINTGVDGFDKGSIFMGGTSNLYYKTNYSSTSWASVDAVD